MLIRILYFLRGYVQVIVRSHFIERFINICIRRDIYLWDIRRRSASEADMKMSMRSFHKLRPIAKKTHSRVHIKRKYGLPMVLHRYKKRYFFFAGLALAVCFVLVMSQFVWSIEVVGNETVSTAEILQVLDGLGLHKGTFRGSVDARDLKNNALLQLDQLSWLWVDIKGSRATVSVSEKRAAPEILDQSAPCDIVASKAGVIKSFNATAGKSAVEVGQTVLEGQLLISGVVTSDIMPESTPARYTHAAGEVYARTWYEQSVQRPLTKEIRTPTGRTASKHTLLAYGGALPLHFNADSPYENYDTVETTHDLVLFGFYTGLSWKTRTYTEVTLSYEPLTPEQAMEEAGPELEAAIASQVGEGAVVAASDLRYTPIDESNILVTLTMEYTEQIGMTKPIDTILQTQPPVQEESGTQ